MFPILSNSCPWKLLHFAFPQAMYESAHFPIAQSIKNVMELLDFCQCDRRRIVSQCNFNMNFSYYKLNWTSFYMFRRHVHLFFCWYLVFYRVGGLSLLKVVYTSGIIIRSKYFFQFFFFFFYFVHIFFLPKVFLLMYIIRFIKPFLYFGFWVLVRKNSTISRVPVFSSIILYGFTFLIHSKFVLGYGIKNE